MRITGPAGHSFYTVETHINYLREVSGNGSLRFATRIVGLDRKRLHLYHEMFDSGSGEPGRRHRADVAPYEHGDRTDRRPSREPLPMALGRDPEGPPGNAGPRVSRTGHGDEGSES